MTRVFAALTCALLLAGFGCRTRERDSTVVLWHAYQGSERRALEKVVDELNASRDDLHVKLVSVPYDAFADKITNAIPNGNGPDLFIFAHDRIGDWVATRIIEPIEFYVDESIADRYAYDAIAAMAYRGSLYGLPLAVKSAALFYRTDRIAKPPRTTDELLAWAQRSKKSGQYALVYDNTSLYGHAPWLHGFGGRVFDDNGKLALASRAATASLEFARSLTRASIVPTESKSTLVTSLFNEGKAALAISGPWFISELEKGVPWAVTTLPIVSATGKYAAPFLGAEGVLMSVRARNKQAAFDVMQYLAGDASAIIRARAARQVVPNSAAYEERDIGGDPVLGAFKRQLEHTVPMPASPEMRMVWTPYKIALQKVIAQGSDPSDALLAAQREVDGYIKGSQRK